MLHEPWVQHPTSSATIFTERRGVSAKPSVAGGVVPLRSVNHDGRRSPPAPLRPNRLRRPRFEISSVTWRSSSALSCCSSAGTAFGLRERRATASLSRFGIHPGRSTDRRGRRARRQRPHPAQRRTGRRDGGHALSPPHRVWPATTRFESMRRRTSLRRGPPQLRPCHVADTASRSGAEADSIGPNAH